MTVITEDFRRLDGIAPFPADLAFVYFTVPRRRENTAGTWVVVPVEVKCRLVAGKLTSPNLDPGEATVRIGPHGPTYSIVIPAADARLWDLIEMYETPDPPVVSLVKQYRDEIEQLKDDIEVAANTFSTTVGEMVESAHTSATTADTRAGQAATSATAAGGSASTAATSAAAAAGSATTASTKAGDAETARAAAVTAKTAAEAARTDAHTAASAAGSKASEASGHATAAAGSAGSAAGSAATASSAATAAGTHAGQAASAASAAAQSAVEAANAVTGVSSVGGLTGAVTKAQLGIDKVDNTRDADKEVSGPTQQALNNLLEAVDSAFTGLSARVDEKTTVTQAQAIATAAVAAVIDNSPEALDTLAELAAALGNDPNFATTVMNLIGQKAASTDPRFTDARSPLGTTQAVWNAGTANSANFGLTPAELRAAVVVAIGATAPQAHTHHLADINGLIETFNSLQDLFNAKVNSYTGQTITFWSGTQAAYDALPAATKTAAGFIAAIF